MKTQSLADFLSVSDPRPEADRPQTDFEQLAAVDDPKEFCRRVLATREFRQYVMNGIVLGDIPPAVVCRVIDHAWGKPVERLEVRTNALEDLSVEQLEARAAYLEEMARRLRGQDDEESGSVH